MNNMKSETPAAPASNSVQRFWIGAVASLGVATAVFLAVCLVLAAQYYNTPFPGFFLTAQGTVNAGRPTSGAEWTGLEAGLKRGDKIMRMGDYTLDVVLPSFSTPGTIETEEIEYALQTTGFDQPIEVVFQRHTNVLPVAGNCQSIRSELVECTLTLRTMRLPDGDFLAYFVIPFISSLIVFSIGLIVLYYRWNRRDGLLIATIGFLTAIFIGGLFETNSTARLSVAWIMGSVLLGGTLITLSLLFPQRLRIIRRLSVIQFAPLALMAVIGVVLTGIYAFPTTRFEDIYSQVTIFSVLACVIMAGAVFLLLQRPLSMTQAARRQTEITLIGLALLVIPALLFMPYQFILARNFQAAPLTFESILPLLIFPNASLAFALLQYRRLDSDRLISTGITYSIMLIALIVATFLLSLGGTLIAIDFLNATNLFTITLILFVMVMLFTPLRMQIQNRIDTVYYRTRRNYTEKVELFSQALVTNSDYADIVAQYRHLVDENIAPNSIFIFVRSRETGDFIAYSRNTDVRFSSESPLLDIIRSSREAIIFMPDDLMPLVLYTEQARLRMLRAQVIAPMTSASETIGFVVISGSRADKPYTFDELRFFTSLTTQLGVGTERTQVIGSLEQRVRELDVLTQVGQAVNFTIEFEDLLELIYAQTSKLVDAPCFYIALYDEKSELASFAFFLEGDDRDSRKEAMRWPLDRGLFSEVVRTKRVLRSDNYGHEVVERKVRNSLISPQVRAWMGVPLTAGYSILGVLAVGKTNSENFTEEQAKIFADIGALAATSIDKARLFAQTRQRERQLTVLNNISQQLVATESDVEKLLQIIMTSAVEILNGEAGSLLLTAEDDATQLEFRVVIGGTEGLLKTRIDARKGIAGDVVKTGKAVIVNDVAESKSNQIVTESYKTQALLAVPLIAKNNVIGVLEVLNKLDGTGFIQEDSELLTTFAGQAAIAIENARLFRMTDIQLAQRVKELEALERIDNDLNRTLDVTEVARITVLSALQTLNAQAGALGIVHESPAFLEIVGIEGYTPEEYPKDADGMRWSLDVSITRRVMRSRQPDLAVDVKIDPDYSPGLSSSLSQITIPMFSGSTINAILILEKSELPRFTLSDWAYAQRLAEHASIAIANAQLYAALTLANKSKSEFMGFAAHELKNPLTSVIGFADLLRQGMTGELSDQQQGLVNIIHSNANRMQTIIQDLRDSARMDANEFSVELSPMHIRHTVIETLRPFVQFMRDKNQDLINLVSEDLPLVLGDENRLIQVLTNLVSNAHKYSPAGTAITINAEVVTNYVDQSKRRREPMMRISVTDEGLGISEEDQKRLFKERYFRSTNQQALEQPGTGLGMTLTYGILEKHHGDIWVESELGKGSTFYIAIPLASQELAESASD